MEDACGADIGRTLRVVRGSKWGVGSRLEVILDVKLWFEKF